MPSQRFAPAPYKEPAKADIRGGMPIEDVAKKYNLSERTAFRYLKEIEDEKTGSKPPPNVPGGKVESVGGGEIATITVPKPAAAVFTLGNQKILIDPADLYESFMLYEDLKVRCSLEDNFSTVLKDGIGLLWEILAKNPKGQSAVAATEISEVKEKETEVNYGSGTGTSEAETGAK